MTIENHFFISLKEAQGVATKTAKTQTVKKKQSRNIYNYQYFF